MRTTEALPTTLLEAIRFYTDEDFCIQHFASIRWPDGPVCPRCDGRDHSYLTTRRVWKCKACRYQFSVKVGTIFEDSPIPLSKWLPAVWLIANTKNGISSHELGKAIGVCQRAAWFVEQRVRLAMRTGSFTKFSGPVEADETYVGGSARKMHAKVRHAKRHGKLTGAPISKTMVMGTIQRKTEDRPSRVHAEPTLNVKWDGPLRHIFRTVEAGADLYTDAAAMYRSMHKDYKHASVDHSRGEYHRGIVGTNAIENFWTLLKRGLFGTYISVKPEHLFRYVDERVFTFNTRDMTDLQRFRHLLDRVAGRRLTYAELTGKVEPQLLV